MICRCIFGRTCSRRCAASASACSCRSRDVELRFSPARSAAADSRQARSSAAASCCRRPAAWAHAMAACSAGDKWLAWSLGELQRCASYNRCHAALCHVMVLISVPSSLSLVCTREDRSPEVCTMPGSADSAPQQSLSNDMCIPHPMQAPLIWQGHNMHAAHRCSLSVGLHLSPGRRGFLLPTLGVCPVARATQRTVVLWHPHMTA